MPVFSRFKVFQRESEQLSLLALRFGVGSMFLWFGMARWSDSSAWLAWSVALGILQFGLGLALLTGRRLRAVSVLGIVTVLGTSLLADVSGETVRDAAILGALLSLLIHANAKMHKPWGTETVAVVCTAYVFLLFLCGVAFLRNA